MTKNYLINKDTSDVPGVLIAVEGVDGSGKSTQIQLLRDWLSSQGLRVYFSEWNSSLLVKEATKKGKKNKLLTSTTFSLIHATDFADRYERQIYPMLKAGFIVLCDRYKYTAFARDGVRNCDPLWLEKLYSFARDPDLIYYYDLPLKVSLSRILSGRPTLKFHEAGMDLNFSNDIIESYKLYQGKIRESYLSMVKKYNFNIINADREIHELQIDLRNEVEKRVNLSSFKEWQNTNFEVLE
tara:strand:+ start:8310 stop:9029 length:720 start_codon:yes stop_codon:yes gene_type:complete